MKLGFLKQAPEADRRAGESRTQFGGTGPTPRMKPKWYPTSHYSQLNKS